jgi:hypothetical protein
MSMQDENDIADESSSREVAVQAPRHNLVAGGAVKAIVPQDFEDGFRLARVIFASGLAPLEYDSPEKIMIAVMTGLELGIPPMQAMQRIAIINKRPTIWGDLAIALVRRSKNCVYVKEWFEGEGDSFKAVCEAKRRDSGEVVRTEFSIADAKRARLWDERAKVLKRGETQDNPSPWFRFWKRMLQMRSRAFCLRDLFADVLGGLYIREELEGVVAGELVEQEQPPEPPAAERGARKAPIHRVKAAARTEEAYADMGAKKGAAEPEKAAESTAAADEAAPEKEAKIAEEAAIVADDKPYYSALMVELDVDFGKARSLKALDDVAQAHADRWYNKAPDGEKDTAKAIFARHKARLGDKLAKGKQIEQDDQAVVTNKKAPPAKDAKKQELEPEPEPAQEDGPPNPDEPTISKWFAAGRAAKDAGKTYNNPPLELRKEGADGDLTQWREGWRERHNEIAYPGRERS